MYLWYKMVLKDYFYEEIFHFFNLFYELRLILSKNRNKWTKNYDLIIFDLIIKSLFIFKIQFLYSKTFLGRQIFFILLD